jgi:hypothetical protein
MIRNSSPMQEAVFLAFGGNPFSLREAVPVLENMRAGIGETFSAKWAIGKLITWLRSGALVHCWDDDAGEIVAKLHPDTLDAIEAGRGTA